MHKVEEHQARVKRAISGNAAVFALLLFCAKHEVEAVLAVVFERRGFVVGIHDKIATSGLVLIIDEPALDAVHKLRAYMSAHIAAVYAEASDKNGWVYHVAFGLRYGFADTFSAGVREMVCEYAGVGDCKCADDFARIVNFKKSVCLPHQLFRVIEIIRGEELVKILVAATERSACGDYFWGKQDADASVIQKGHLPDSLSFLTRLAFFDSKLRHISRLKEKSTLPRLRAFFSAVRTKRIAASPDRTGMLLIASAISYVPCLETCILYHEYGQCGKGASSESAFRRAAWSSTATTAPSSTTRRS